MAPSARKCALTRRELTAGSGHALACEARTRLNAALVLFGRHA